MEQWRRLCKWRWLASLVAAAIIGIVVTFSASAVAAIRGGGPDARIAFDSVRDGTRDIYVINPFAGGRATPAPDPNPIRLTAGPDDAKPSWSPPAPMNWCGPDMGPARPTMIAFQRTVNGNTNIYVIGAPTPAQPNGGQAVQLTHGGSDTAPAWAPDGIGIRCWAPKLRYPPIAFERKVNGHRDIFIANYNGSEETNLTNSSGADYANPDWSPGGASDSPRLAFDSNQGGRREVWVMDVGYNESNPTNHRYVNLGMRQVTTGQPVSSNPSWFTSTPPEGAPDAFTPNHRLDRIAFGGPDQDGGASQINLADSTTVREASSTEPFADPNSIEFSALTSDPSEHTAPAWSPFGDSIAYQKTGADGKSDIYALDPMANDETADVNLTQHVGDNKNPDWEAPQVVAVEVFPIRPRGRRSRKRHAQDLGPPVAHTLTASLTGSGKGVVTGAGISCPPTCVRTYADATMVSLGATAVRGSTFAGWAGAGCSGTGPCTVSLSSDVQVRATFTLVPPVLSALTVLPRKFTLTGRRVKGRCVPASSRNRRQVACARAIALGVSYRLSIPARVTVTIYRELAGRVSSARCVPATRTTKTGRRCVRLISVGGRLIRASAAGANRFTFNGVIGGRRIRPGSYRVIATPSVNGTAGNAQTSNFQILR
jgi:Tol biopolymer transport system component